jgi:hypothetical protein
MVAADTATPQPKAWHALSSTSGPGENTWVALMGGRGWVQNHLPLRLGDVVRVLPLVPV